MNLQVNGQDRQFDTPMTVETLLKHLELEGERIAVECNGTILTREDCTTQVLADGDKLEIVRFVGGG